MSNTTCYRNMIVLIQTSDKDSILISYKDFKKIEDHDDGKRLADLKPNVFVNDKRDLLVGDLKLEVDSAKTPNSLRIIDALIKAKENLRIYERP